MHIPINIFLITKIPLAFSFAFVPSFIDAEKQNNNVLAVKDLSKINNLTAKIVQLLDDTVMLAGSEAMVASQPIYHFIAAKSNFSGTLTSSGYEIPDTC
ncbi:MAG TPA: hypothetical protein VHO70_21535 [Chitinispirillaceae bacterium]|nr:hypothetical protein [Chitinispirillaceae bacterium]